MANATESIVFHIIFVCQSWKLQVDTSNTEKSENSHVENSFKNIWLVMYVVHVM